MALPILKHLLLVEPERVLHAVEPRVIAALLLPDRRRGAVLGAGGSPAESPPGIDLILGHRIAICPDGFLIEKCRLRGMRRPEHLLNIGLSRPIEALVEVLVSPGPTAAAPWQRQDDTDAEQRQNSQKPLRRTGLGLFHDRLPAIGFLTFPQPPCCADQRIALSQQPGDDQTKRGTQPDRLRMFQTIDPPDESPGNSDDPRRASDQGAESGPASRLFSIHDSFTLHRLRHCCPYGLAFGSIG